MGHGAKQQQQSQRDDLSDWLNSDSNTGEKHLDWRIVIGDSLEWSTTSNNDSKLV